MLPRVAKRLLDSVEIPPDGLEHNFERRRVHWFENSIFKTPLLTVDQSRRRGVKFSEQFISASRRGSCPKDPRNWITDRHDIPRDAGPCLHRLDRSRRTLVRQRATATFAVAALGLAVLAAVAIAIAIAIPNVPDIGTIYVTVN
jgi:hypothetical protein